MKIRAWFVFAGLLCACDKKPDPPEGMYSLAHLIKSAPPEAANTSPQTPSQPQAPEAKPEPPRSAEDQAVIDSVMEARAHGAPLNNCPDDPCPTTAQPSTPADIPQAMGQLPVVQAQPVDPSVAQRQELQRQMQLQQLRMHQQQAMDQAFDTQMRLQCHSSCRMYPNGDMMGCIRDCDRR